MIINLHTLSDDELFSLASKMYFRHPRRRCKSNPQQPNYFMSSVERRGIVCLSNCNGMLATYRIHKERLVLDERP